MTALKVTLATASEVVAAKIGEGEVLVKAGRRLNSVRLGLSGPRVVSSSVVLKASYAGADHPNYDVSPDGKQCVIVTGRARPQRLVVAINPFNTSAARP